MITDLFPFPDFRAGQKEALHEAKEGIEDDETEVVVLDLPTGLGKSAINTTLARSVDGAYITTPQTSLRKQMAEDDVLKDYYHVLKAKDDYVCDKCERSATYCSMDDTCPGDVYERARAKARNADISLMTVALLAMVDNEEFVERDTLVVDEAHGIEGYTANLLAGFTASPNHLPEEVYGDIAVGLKKDTKTHHGEVYDLVGKLKGACQTFVGKHGESQDRLGDVQDCLNFISSAERFFEETNRGLTWTVNVFDTENSDGDMIRSFSVKPVDVAPYLRENFWSRGETIVLSTATYPGEKWLGRIGLDPNKTKVISADNPFPMDNRMIRISDTVCKMSRKRDMKNWTEIMETVDRIGDRHEGQKGVVHTVSYYRAERIENESDQWDNLKDNVIVANYDGAFDDWQNSDKDILLSPSMTEGVDLKGEMCEWQIMLKIPFPSLADSRVEYLINRKNRWDWYYQVAATDIVQAAGRAVRSEKDKAEFYILDECFNDVHSRANFPEWFTRAITPLTPV